MMTSKPSALFLFLACLIAVSGCNREPAKPQAVMINMPAVTEAVHMAARLKAFSDRETKSINAEMKELGENYMKMLEETEITFGEQPSQEQQDQLKRMRTRLQKQYNRARMTANGQMNREKNALRQSILDEITPTAQQVAAEYGATVIIRDDSVFWAEASLDITSEVISRLPAEATRDPDARAEDTEAAEKTGAAEDTEPADTTEATAGE